MQTVGGERAAEGCRDTGNISRLDADLNPNAGRESRTGGGLVCVPMMVVLIKKVQRGTSTPFTPSVTE